MLKPNTRVGTGPHPGSIRIVQNNDNLKQPPGMGNQIPSIQSIYINTSILCSTMYIIVSANDVLYRHLGVRIFLQNKSLYQILMNPGSFTYMPTWNVHYPRLLVPRNILINVLTNLHKEILFFLLQRTNLSPLSLSLHAFLS